MLTCGYLQVKQLADEIIAHIREVAGAEAMLAAYTEARKSVTATRMERKRRSAMQVKFHTVNMQLYVSCYTLFVQSSLSWLTVSATNTVDVCQVARAMLLVRSAWSSQCVLNQTCKLCWCAVGVGGS